MARLRAECDWKSMQTHRSLARYLLEETYETLEAIDTGDLAHLREELGDLLLQVYFHAEIAAQHGDFDIDDVAGDLIAKLVRRNPHVFGDAHVSGAASVNELWESVKATEKARDSVLDGIPPTLPALLYADKILDRLARASGQLWPHEPAVVAPRAGTNGPDDPVVVSTGSTTETSTTPHDLGDRLLALVAECREAGVDPEQALREAVRRIL
jgi:MazG family protein